MLVVKSRQFLLQPSQNVPEDQFQLFQAQLRNVLFRHPSHCFPTFGSRQKRFRERHRREQNTVKNVTIHLGKLIRRYIGDVSQLKRMDRFWTMKSCREPRQRDTIEILSGRGYWLAIDQARAGCLQLVSEAN